MDYEKVYKNALKKAQEGKPIEEIFPELKKSKDKIMSEATIQLINGCGYLYAIIDGLKIDKNDVVAWLEKQGEQKPIEPALAKIGDDGRLDKTWNPKEQNNDDKKWLTTSDFERIKQLNYEYGFEEGVKSVKPVEWSEEDEKMIELIESSTWNNERLNQGEAGVIHNWLKSLRPQSHWKPSDFQMSCLQKAINQPDTELGCEIEDCLQELFDDLKKLK